MLLKRKVSWFLSDQGRKFSFALVTSSGLTFTMLQFAPHTFLVDKYKDFVAYYSNGKQVDLPKEILDRYEKCLDILGIANVHRKILSPFSAFGYDLFNAGSLSSRFGVVIGIPVNFTYKSLDDIKKDNIQVNLKKVDWNSETGKKLADALILPEKVQEFAICREIIMGNNRKVYFDSVYPFASTFCVYNFCLYINKRLNLYAAPTFVRSTLYSIVGFFGLGTYFLMKDMTQIYYETDTDRQLCKLGKEFVESGVIFYEKLLQRNQALRELMGSEGERKYSVLGNENFFIRQPRIALIHRKQFFEQKLKELNNEENTLM